MLKVRHTAWNNCAGHGKRIGPVYVWKKRRYNYKGSHHYTPFHMQIFITLRPYKAGRKSSYLWIIVGDCVTRAR